MSLGNEFEPILAAARGGAEQAWRQLYKDLAPVVLRYLRARGAPDPEDLTAETFLLVVGRLHQFEGGERDLRAWVLTIAHHRYVDSIRAKSRRPSEPVPEEQLTEVGELRDVEQEALENLAGDELRNEISKLSPDQRDVLFLRLLAGLSVNEVAAATGKTPGAVKSLQVRAIGALRRKMVPSSPEVEAVSR